MIRPKSGPTLTSLPCIFEFLESNALNTNLATTDKSEFYQLTLTACYLSTLS